MLSRLQRYGPLNSHDVVKMLALVAMTIDHIGSNIFIDELWWRAVGRSFIPVWFFLVGYAPHTRITPALWISALVVAAFTAITYTPFFALNVLFTIMVCRFVLTLCTRHGWIERKLPELLVACFVFYIVTMPVFEYGTLAVAFAIFGRMARDDAPLHQRQAMAIGLAAAYSITQIAAFGFSPLQGALVTVMAVLCAVMLYRFRMRPVAMPAVLSWPVQLLSRYSLEYYVLHRCALKCLAAFVLGTAPAHFTWFAW